MRTRLRKHTATLPAAALAALLVPTATAQTRADIAGTAILDRTRGGYCSGGSTFFPRHADAAVRTGCAKAWAAAGTASARGGPGSPPATFLSVLGGIEAAKEGKLKAGAAFDLTTSSASPGAFPLAHHWQAAFEPLPDPKPSTRLAGAWPYVHVEPARGVTLSAFGGFGLSGQARFGYRPGPGDQLAASAGGSPSQHAIGFGASWRRQLAGPLYVGATGHGIAVRQSTGSILTRAANPARQALETLSATLEDRLGATRTRINALRPLLADTAAARAALALERDRLASGSGTASSVIESVTAALTTSQNLDSVLRGDSATAVEGAVRALDAILCAGNPRSSHCVPFIDASGEIDPLVLGRLPVRGEPRTAIERSRERLAQTFSSLTASRAARLTAALAAAESELARPAEGEDARLAELGRRIGSIDEEARSLQAELEQNELEAAELSADIATRIPQLVASTPALIELESAAQRSSLARVRMGGELGGRWRLRSGSVTAFGEALHRRDSSSDPARLAGTGWEAGGGFAVERSSGFSFSVRGRYLLRHSITGASEWSVIGSASFRLGR